MSQRDSGYERKERDLYETPAWVTMSLGGHLRDLSRVWEPACGSGQMVEALKLVTGTEVSGTDIEDGKDFLTFSEPPIWGTDAIVTNPPYALANEFIDHALDLMRPVHGLVAMLLRTDFDHARSRARFFNEHPAFERKVVLTRRIRWFEGTKGSPSFNHAWFIWDWQHQGEPTLAYAP